MFTGIIEDIAEVINITKEGDNINVMFKSSITPELKIDQSISHNGVCLTVIDVKSDGYEVTVINETLKKSNLGLLELGSRVNLERSIKLGDRLDGHMVQGHVDQTSICTNIKDCNGSYVLTFEYKGSDNLTVEKGSICVNGVSLTVIDSQKNSFSVAIIPYTFKHTNLYSIKVGSVVNLEFDILGKYISKMIKSL